MDHLYRWKIKQSNKCVACDEIETLHHAIYDCPIAKESIRSIETVINDKLGTNLRLKYEQVLLGTMSSLDPDLFQTCMDTRNGIDVLLVLYKQNIILQRDTKRAFTVDDIKSIINDRIMLDRYLDRRYMKNNRFLKKWVSFM